MTLKLAKFTNLFQCWWILVSLLNRIVERRGWQDARVWQMWQGYCLRVLSWFALLFSGLLQKDLFKGGWSLAKNFFKPNYCHACYTGFSVSFLLPPCCVSYHYWSSSQLEKKWKDLWTQTSKVVSPILEFWKLRTNLYHFGPRGENKLRMGPSNSLRTEIL